MRELILDPKECVDCGICERSCPNNAIHVYEGVPLFCMHCSPDKAPCLLSCPEGAIEYLGGAITINQEKCIGCGICRDACPIGAINMDNTHAKKCDLCINKDTQYCIEACPTGALSNNSQNLINKKQEKVAKEFNYLKKISEKLH
ncbi:4Fe-4S dicluster domain-containing protein [uncultured Methanobrevibacter sp.]|uniref:4Fe-4S dicluster domain-containing protein n=1 Tax=uncultured Methanobrevibacter sp. TaxID=253161 RepID=UPI002582CE64|nr:4Fe-4S binding protein [uncultured Methanobrevibacter sp.]